MEYKINDKVSEEAVSVFGDGAQIIRTIENMAKLTQSLSRTTHEDYDNKLVHDIAADLSNVYIYLDQIESIFKSEDKQFQDLVKANIIKNTNKLKREIEDFVGEIIF